MVDVRIGITAHPRRSNSACISDSLIASLVRFPHIQFIFQTSQPGAF
jgi:hypothetical protein